MLSIMLNLAKYYYVKHFSGQHGFFHTMNFSVKYWKTFSFWFVKKCIKINGAYFRPGGLLYYSLCHNKNNILYNNFLSIITFRGWSSLFRKHTPSKILMNKHNASILRAWTSFFHKHAPACFRDFQHDKMTIGLTLNPNVILPETEKD